MISTINEPRVRLRVGHQHSRFLSMLNHFVDYYSTFWGPRAISMVIEPQGALTCRSSTIAIWADFGPFLALLLSFGGPRVISTIDELRCAFTCRLSRLTSLADSGPFHALLLTVLASQSTFQDCKSPGCVYVSVINTHNFGQFLRVSWTITHHSWVPKRFP